MPLILDGTTGIVANNIAANTITASNIASGSRLATGNMPAGVPLQIVTSTTSTQITTTSTSFVTTGLSVSITPYFSSSKILFMYSVGDVGTTNSNSGVSLIFFKNGSQLGSHGLFSRHSYADTSATENYVINGLAGVYMDAPATTSSTTYALYYNNAGDGTVTIFRDNTIGYLIAMEIAQ